MIDADTKTPQRRETPHGTTWRDVSCVERFVLGDICAVGQDVSCVERLVLGDICDVGQDG